MWRDPGPAPPLPPTHYSLVQAFEQESWVPHHVVVLSINTAISDETFKGVDLPGFQA